MRPLLTLIASRSGCLLLSTPFLRQERVSTAGNHKAKRQADLLTTSSTGMYKCEKRSQNMWRSAQRAVNLNLWKRLAICQEEGTGLFSRFNGDALGRSVNARFSLSTATGGAAPGISPGSQVSCL